MEILRTTRFIIKGPQGEGLVVSQNEETGAISLCPVSPEVGSGFCLSPEAAKDLSLLLSVICAKDTGFSLAV